jgi:hypothetical protein
MTSYSVNGYELRSPSGKTYYGGASLDEAVARKFFLQLPDETEVIDLDVENTARELTERTT